MTKQTPETEELLNSALDSPGLRSKTLYIKKYAFKIQAKHIYAKSSGLSRSLLNTDQISHSPKNLQALCLP